MRNFSLATVCILLAAFCIISCKKSEDMPDFPHGLSYEYNGSTYDGSVGNWGLSFEGDDVKGLAIDRRDLFGGLIVFTTADCAYLDPDGDTFVEHPGCILTNGDGTPIDSSAVYIYESGIINSTSTNCINKDIYDIATGEYYTERLCDINGSFSLVLTNNKGDKIEIKNGSFRGRFQF